MGKIVIGGREIPLLFTTRAFYSIEKEIGALVDLNEKLGGDERVRNAVKMIFYTGNEGLRAAGEKADLTEDWIWDNLKPYQLTEWQVAILDTVHEAWNQETYEEPEVRDGFAEENAKKGRVITWRRLISFGLIAGLTFEETQNMTPGMVIDLYIMRRDYDDQQHGIKRGEE